MRSLKFRAWDKAEKKMLFDADPFAIHVSGSNEPLLAETHRNEDCIFEQYTGLKDKNGKEIYEGDIVQIDSMDELRVGYVELVADQYCIVCGEEDGHKIVAEFYYYSKPEENCKVIGNIHENPELLEQGNAKD